MRAGSRHFGFIMRVPPFLQGLAASVHPSQARPLKAVVKERKAVLEDRKRGQGSLPLVPSAPSTASTATGELASKTNDGTCIDNANGGQSASPDTPTLPKALPTVSPLESRSMRKAEEPSVASLVPVTKPEKYDTLTLRESIAPRAPSHFKTIADGGVVATQRQWPSTEQLQHTEASVVLVTDVVGRKDGMACTSNSDAYDYPMARLAAALAASSLRLAAAAEEGLDSPPHIGSPLCVRDGGATALTSGECNGKDRPSYIRVHSPTPPQGNYESEASAGKARSSSRNSATCEVIKGPMVSPIAHRRRVLSHAPSKSGPRGCTTQIRCRSNCCSPTREFEEIAEERRHRSLKATSPEAPLAALSSVHCGDETLSKQDQRCCCKSSTCSAYSGNSKLQPEEGASPPVKTPPHAAKEPYSPDFMPMCNETQGTHCILKTGAPSAVQYQRQNEVQRIDEPNTGVTPPEEEQQFSLLLQHSMGLLRREAARCFASSQASARQKLWAELQKERLLRLQREQQHQKTAAAAEAELASLRERRLGDHARTEKLLGICCRRKELGDAFHSLQTSWRAWRHQLVLIKKGRQVQQLLKKRRLLILLLRTFVPWRAEATRRLAQKTQQRAQRLLHHELQRMEQIYLEGKQQTQKELIQLRQQLEKEIRLRECLQQSLLEVVSGGLLAFPPRATLQTNNSGMTEAASKVCDMFNGKEQMNQRKQRLQQQSFRQRNLPTVRGVSSNLKGSAANVRPPQQPAKFGQPRNIQKQYSWQLFSQDMQTDHLPLGVSGSHSASYDSRRVKFLDDEAQQQQQQLLLLASLLAAPQPSNKLGIDERLSISPGLEPLLLSRLASLPRLRSSASAPAVACWGSPKAPAATEKARPAPADGLLRRNTSYPSKGALSEDCNTPGCCEASTWPLHCNPLVEADIQPPKEMRWTAATHP